MDIELPSSAVAVLRVTYDSLFSQRKLPYKDRRKLWKKYKRKKARIINHFAILKLQCDSSLHESDYPDDDEHCSDLPEGPLTNAAIIRYLKSLESSRNTEILGILRNPIRASKSIALDEVEPAAQVVGNQSDSPINFSNALSISEGKEGTDIALTEESARPDHETDEITRLLAELDDEVERWQNPSPPADYQPPIEKNKTTVELLERPTLDITSSDLLDDSRPLCSFYSKTGACRFGNRCSKKHESVSSSDTLVFLNMFRTFLFDLEDRLRVSGDVHDLSLEHSEQDLYEEFAEFYFEIQPELREIGRISHLYVCRNRCYHLRGNVYVQYLSKEDAKDCFDKMCGRYFAGKPLVCSYVNISSWAGTLCGIDIRTGKCSRGGQCNYLHVFRTPNSKKYGNRVGSPHTRQSKSTNRKESRSSRLKCKSSKSSPRTHDRLRRKNSKDAYRHSRSKHVHRRSRSPSTGAEAKTVTVSNTHCHESSTMAVNTFENTKRPYFDDVHSSAESDKNDHNSYREKKRQKKSKKKKKKHKKKD